jgi:2-hydroxychromene-2-carboxylate isomerase
MPPAIEFFFDYISPYAYLAWTQIHRMAARHGREVRPTPVLFAGLLNANGQLGPAEIPSKRLYVFKDALRSASLLGLPFRGPPTHPYNPLLSLRITHAELDKPHAVRVIDRLFHATWGSGAGVETADQVAAVLTELGLDVADVMARAHSAAIKQALRDNTDRAVAAGVFGVPTMLVGGELFWGYDSLGHLDRYLAGQESLDRSLVEQWARITSTADRRRDRT